MNRKVNTILCPAVVISSRAELRTAQTRRLANQLLGCTAESRLANQRLGCTAAGCEGSDSEMTAAAGLTFFYNGYSAIADADPCSLMLETMCFSDNQ